MMAHARMTVASAKSALGSANYHYYLPAFFWRALIDAKPRFYLQLNIIMNIATKPLEMRLALSWYR